MICNSNEPQLPHYAWQSASRPCNSRRSSAVRPALARVDKKNARWVGVDRERPEVGKGRHPETNGPPREATGQVRQGGAVAASRRLRALR